MFFLSFFVAFLPTCSTWHKAMPLIGCCCCSCICSCICCCCCRSAAVKRITADGWLPLLLVLPFHVPLLQPCADSYLCCNTLPPEASRFRFSSSLVLRMHRSPGFFLPRLAAIGSDFCWLMIKWHFVRVNLSLPSGLFRNPNAKNLQRFMVISCLLEWKKSMSRMFVAVNLTLNEVRNYKIKPRSMWGSFVFGYEKWNPVLFAQLDSFCSPATPPHLRPRSINITKAAEWWVCCYLSALRCRAKLVSLWMALIVRSLGMSWLVFGQRNSALHWIWSSQIDGAAKPKEAGFMRWQHSGRHFTPPWLHTCAGNDSTTIWGNASLISRAVDFVSWTVGALRENSIRKYG